MAEFILVAGYSYDEFRGLHDTAPDDVIYEYADSPAELTRLSCSRKYNCIFCHTSVLDSVPYICAMRRIQTVPIIIGSIPHFKTVRTIKHYIDAAAQHNSFIAAGDMRVDFERRIVSVQGHKISLTATEFDILSLLISNPQRVFTYEMIVDIIWNEDCTFYSKKVIHNHVSNIKKKIRTVSPKHKYIVSVHGIGYKFEVE